MAILGDLSKRMSGEDCTNNVAIVAFSKTVECTTSFDNYVGEFCLKESLSKCTSAFSCDMKTVNVIQKKKFRNGSALLHLPKRCKSTAGNLVRKKFMEDILER